MKKSLAALFMLAAGYSVLAQSNATKSPVGIFTTNPAISLDVRTGTLPQMGIAGIPTI